MRVGDRRFGTALVGAATALALAACTSGAAHIPVTATPTTSGSQVHRGVVSPAAATGWTFANQQLTFRYDRSWTPSTWSIVSTAATSIVYLSSQSTHDPCVTITPRAGITETDCTSPIGSLAAAGVLIDWYYYGLPGTSLRYESGRTTTFAGHPARLASGAADTACARIDGSRSVDAVIDPEQPDGGPSLLHMDACLTSPAQTAQVIAMLGSLRFTPTPVAPTSPAQFPSVASDDPCGPLRNDPDYRHPIADGPVPRSSTVTAARWCLATPGPHGEQFQRYRSTGDVTALNRALHAPAPATAPADLTCPAGPPQFPVTVEILDQDGRLSYPTLPTDACGAISGTREALTLTAAAALSGT